jgi:arabinofuranosyltransferase
LTPLIVVYMPYYILRFLYYHYPFPNTYYARSAYLPWWNQGLKYLVLYFRSYYIFLLLPALGVISLVKTKVSIRRLTHLPFHFNPIQNSVFLSIIFSVVYSFYLVRIGGDFMFARFFIPVTPFLYFLMEAFASRTLDKKYLIPFSIIVCLTTYFYWYPNKIGSLGYDIIDERLFYPKWRIEEAKLKGGVLKKYLKNTEAQVVIYGSQAMLAYYGELPTVIEGDNGLTDEYIAHLPIGKRIRPGHEKRAPIEYLLRRGVNFSFVFGLSNPPPSADFNEIYFEDLRGDIIVYNRNLMRTLATYDEITFFDFERFLDEYIQKMPSFPRSRILEDYQFFRHYYFDHNSDPIRENAFVNFVANH